MIDGKRKLAQLKIGDSVYQYYSLAAVDAARVARLPYTLKILLENLLRQRAEGAGRDEDVSTLLAWLDGRADREIRFCPVRVMMDDTAGIPLIGDLAAMRDAAARLGGDPKRVAPVLPVDFVVDHSVIADHTAAPDGPHVVAPALFFPVILGASGTA